MSGLAAAGWPSARDTIGRLTVGNNAGRIGITIRDIGYDRTLKPLQLQWLFFRFRCLIFAIMNAAGQLRVGVISDTHGLLRAEARAFLVGCDYILHAGDIGGAALLDELEVLAPVTAVRGNNDQEPWAKHLKKTELVRLGGIFAYLIHDLSLLDIDPSANGIRIVISGHSHRPLIETREGVLYINPGSCGPRRFKLPISVGELIVEESALRARTLEL
jgi:uncharacterized protein